jgi:putative hydrolase of the HAD superfamily
MGRTKRELKAVFFDIDDTLFSTSEFAKAARLNSVYAMIRAGLKCNVNECIQELKEVIEEFGSNYEHHYDRLLLRLPKESYKDVNPAVIVAAGVVAYHQTKSSSLKPYDDVIETLRILSNTNLILGIITAGLKIKQAEKLVRLDLLKYLSPKAIFITDQIGIGKPNVKLYKNACEALELDPKSCMYVGDNPISDIDPPNTLGMFTILSRRSGKYLSIVGKTSPTYTISDMWDLLKIIKEDFGISV